MKELKFCGRIITDDISIYDPWNFEGIINSSLPITAAELFEFLQCAQWMAQDIPNFLFVFLHYEQY